MSRQDIMEAELLEEINAQDKMIFTSQNNHTKVLSRETFSREITGLLKQISLLLKIDNLTSFSFRKGYITKLYIETQKIKTVREFIRNKNSL